MGALGVVFRAHLEIFVGRTCRFFLFEREAVLAVFLCWNAFPQGREGRSPGRVLFTTPILA